MCCPELLLTDTLVFVAQRWAWKAWRGTIVLTLLVAGLAKGVERLPLAVAFLALPAVRRFRQKPLAFGASLARPVPTVGSTVVSIGLTNGAPRSLRPLFLFPRPGA